MVFLDTRTWCYWLQIDFIDTKFRLLSLFNSFRSDWKGRMELLTFTDRERFATFVYTKMYDREIVLERSLIDNVNKKKLRYLILLN